MCMSVPQIAVLSISMSTSFGPTLGSGTSSSQIPGVACFLTSAFMLFDLNACSVDDAELTADGRERCDGAVQLLPGESRRHLCADARLSLGYDLERKANDIDTALQKLIGHAAGQGGVAQHHWNDGV